jgi:hypothetical protein
MKIATDVTPLLLQIATEEHQQDAEKVRQRRSRIVQTLHVPQRVRVGPSLAAALLDDLFEHPARSCPVDLDMLANGFSSARNRFPMTASLGSERLNVWENGRDGRGLIWFIWSVWFVWFNQTNETDQISKRDQPVLALHASRFTLAV